jgi:hypothetical protein
MILKVITVKVESQDRDSVKLSMTLYVDHLTWVLYPIGPESP